MNYNKTKIYKIYGLCIKTVIIVLAFWFIYRRLFVKDNLDDMIRQFDNSFSKPSFIRGILLVIILMIINWSIETFKWKFLIRKIEKVSFLNALLAVFSGITVSIFTPNRVGEYAGRVFVLEKADRWEGVLITMLGSISQLLVTIIAGAVAFIFFAFEFLDLFHNNTYYFSGLILITCISLFLLLFLFFNISSLTSIFNKLPLKLQKLRHYGLIFSYYKKTELLIVLFLSLCRYLIFITQFYLLFKIFGVDITFSYSFMMVSLIYLAMAAIPTIALTELGIRGSVALYFVGLYFDVHNPAGQNDLGIITASSMMWLINLAIPAIFGAIFVFRLKFFRKV
jgi:uncharacterized membrane protein YbhN (UPF0104 family)